MEENSEPEDIQEQIKKGKLKNYNLGDDKKNKKKKIKKKKKMMMKIQGKENIYEWEIKFY